jgi:hypothetical protein
MVAQETLDRYFLPVLPLLVYAWWQMLLSIYSVCREWTTHYSMPRFVPNVVFVALLGFGACANVAKVGGIIVQQREVPFLSGYDKGTFEVMPKFARLVHDHTGPEAVILCGAPYGRVTAFLADRFASNGVGIQLSRAKGHIFIVEPSDLLLQSKLRQAGLVEGPAMFTVTPSANHGEKAVAMSLHSTYKK